MQTRSSQIMYDHPFVAVHDATIRMDYGWYAHIMCDLHSSDLLIDPVFVPHVDMLTRSLLQGKSVQATWMV
jgi:hypothetical protein